MGWVYGCGECEFLELGAGKLGLGEIGVGYGGVKYYTYTHV